MTDPVAVSGGRRPETCDLPIRRTATPTCGVVIACHNWGVDFRGLYCRACGERPVSAREADEIRRYVARTVKVTPKGPAQTPRLKPDEKRARRAARAAALHQPVAHVGDTIAPAYLPDAQTGRAARRIDRVNAQVSVRSKEAKRAFVRGWIATYGRTCFFCDRTLDDPDDYPEITAAQIDVRTRAGTWPTVEHLIPSALGGPSKVWNLVVACGPCNTSKGDDMEYLVRLLRSQRDLLRERDADLANARATIGVLKRDLIALGSDTEPSYNDGLRGGEPGRPSHCRRCGWEFLPGVRHRCIPREDRDLYVLYDEYGRRAVAGAIAENHPSERRRYTVVRDKAAGALGRAAARTASPKVPTEPHD